ncbi:F-box protein [Candidatus Odyssella acanthamoebae]|uniref:F-box domain-containing protein n=1 Tax=Candidatus Odyssella acanthamoebae TaxID=91604 RepID=A0A077AVM0_9PROT|nr:F-box protein [Candidatus Paracaedibacter acanthamoebae]AIK96094.1 hypothetical protein ID47_04070 [Candidatus Paracaedibacter acanthamoebae]
MKFKHLFASFLLTMVTHQAFSSESLEEEDKASVIQQTTLESEGSIGVLPDEMMIKIFSLLELKNIPSVTETNQRWQRLMNDNQLWKSYAKRAHLIMDDGDNTQDRDYKELIKYHCTYSFEGLNTLNINNETESWIHEINFDGSEVLGEAEEGYNPRKRYKFKWTPEKGMEFLRTLNDVNKNALSLYVMGGTMYFNDTVSDNDIRDFSLQLARLKEELSRPLISSDIIESQTEMVNFDALNWLSGISPEPKYLTEACEWISGHGMKALQQLLTDKGLLPPGWELVNVSKITASRTVLIGEANFDVVGEDGMMEILERAWHAVIPRKNLF